MPRVFLGALGWVNETPIGNRLRWSVPVDHEVGGRFLGLPTSVIVERSVLPPGPAPDSTFFESPTFPIPVDWWEPQGNLPVPAGVATRVNLPKIAQAVRFIYQGPETMVRVLDAEAELVSVHRLVPGEPVLIEQTEIAALDFLVGGGEMAAAAILDLFAGHDAEIEYEQIAVLAPAASVAMTLEQAEERLPTASGIELDEWNEFQQEIVPEALLSTPDTPSFEDSGLTRWTQFKTLLSVRWRLSLLYGFGFLDGPDAGSGAPPDQIASSLLLQDLPTRPHVYRVRCLFEDHPVIISNPIAVLPLPASPLQMPQNIGYDHARVRLFDEQEYELDARLSIGASDRRVIGCDIEEEVGPSAILGTQPTIDGYTFQSWRPTDTSGAMQVERATTLPFYDLPLRFRARSVDGWDRASEWSDWTAQILPKFIHSPLPPPLMDAQFTSQGQTRIFPRTPGNRFSEWSPDHAAANTPGTVLEVMRQTAEPAVVEVELFDPVFDQAVIGEPLDGFRANFTAPLPQPERFAGGSLIAGAMRSTITQIDADSVVFRPVNDGGDTSAMPGAGAALLHQTPTHPDLFTGVASFAIDDIPGIVAFEDLLPEPDGMTEIDQYAVRVEMGIVTGGLSNTVSVMRQPTAPATPPPFSVELLGVDFYQRTMVRIRFLEFAPPGTYVITWADGLHDAADLHELAIEGDYGPQAPVDGLELFEVFSLPVPSNLERVVTFGVQAKTTGGFVSPYATLPFNLPVYEA